MDHNQLNRITNFIWDIADNVLRDVYVRGKYSDVILPMTVIRRFDAVLVPTKQVVLETKEKLDKDGTTDQYNALIKASRRPFYNTSPFTLSDLPIRTNQYQLQADFKMYLDGFSPNVKEIIQKLEFYNQIAKLARANLLSGLLEKFLDPSINFSDQPILNSDGSVQLEALDSEEAGIMFEVLLERYNAHEEGGEHFTPLSISELLAKLVNPQPGEKIYDPACGTGSLLIKFIRDVGSSDCTLFGQEINESTWALAMSNVLLNNVNSFYIKLGDTLRNPLLLEENCLMKFDVIASQPPFGLGNWGYEEWQNDKYGRNISVLPPKRSSDFAWVLHAIASMKPDTGRIAIVVPPDMLFRGGTEQVLRQYLIKNDLIDAVISLAPKLLYNTAIPINILVLRARKAPGRKGKILFINGSQLIESVDKRNKISAKSISQIISWYSDFVDIPGLVKVVPQNELGKTGWKLHTSHYIKPQPGKLLENAIVSIRLGLDDFEMGTEERIVSSIRNLYAGILLLFKEKLLRLCPDNSDEVLIRSEVAPVNAKGKIRFVGVGRKTVEVAQIRKRFENLDVKVDWKRVEAIQSKRNDIEHYFTVEKEDAIREVISNTFMVISEFIKNELNDDPRELLGAKYWQMMLNTSDLYERQRNDCLNLLKQINWEPSSISQWIEEIRCSSCNSSLIAPGDVIMTEVQDQYFTCTACGQSIPYADLLEALVNNRSLEEEGN